MKKSLECVVILFVLTILLTACAKQEPQMQTPPETEVEIGELRPHVIEELDVRISAPAAAQTAGPEELVQDWDNMDSYWWELYDCLDWVGQEEFAYTLLPKFRFEEEYGEDSIFVGYAATQDPVDDPAAMMVESMETMSERELKDLIEAHADMQRFYPIEGLTAQAVLYRNEQAPYICLLHTEQTEDWTVWVDVYMTDYKGSPYVFVFWGTELADRVRAEAIMDTVVLQQSVN